MSTSIARSTPPSRPRRVSGRPTHARSRCASAPPPDASWWAPPPPDGPHPLSRRPRGAAGNVDGTPAVGAFTVATPARETSIGDGPAEGSSTPETPPTFALLSAEGRPGYQCSLDV